MRGFGKRFVSRLAIRQGTHVMEKAMEGSCRVVAGGNGSWPGRELPARWSMFVMDEGASGIQTGLDVSHWSMLAKRDGPVWGSEDSEMLK